MKRKIGRKVNFGIKNSTIKISINNVEISDSDELYKFICDKNYPQK